MHSGITEHAEVFLQICFKISSGHKNVVIITELFEDRKNTIFLNCTQDLAQISYICLILYSLDRLGSLKSLSYKSVKVYLCTWDHLLVLQTYICFNCWWFNQKISVLPLHQSRTSAFFENIVKMLALILFSTRKKIPFIPKLIKSFTMSTPSEFCNQTVSHA